MSDDFEEQMKRLREIRDASSKLWKKMNARDWPQGTANQTNLPQNLAKMPYQNTNELFLQVLAQQNQFHERLMSKLDEIINALKK